jgi:heptaprenyl diphosphate synthase
MSAQNNPISPVRRLTRGALLTAIALTIFMVEAQIPAPIPIPGVKLGLSNIITVYAMYLLGPADTLMILLSRIFLGAVFSGQMMTLLYSLGGGLCCFCAMLVLRRIISKDHLWITSACCGLFHNLGQLTVAAGVMKTWAVMAYLPYLVLAGVCAGVFTGLCTQFLVRRLDRI